MIGSTFFLAVTCLLINSAGSQKIQSVACEGSEAQLKCGKGQVISVSRATYGRLDRNTCSSGRPDQQLKNIKCSSSSEKVAERCNGKQQCDFKADNSEFGDPCQGTYKYLEVEYTCEEPEKGSPQKSPTVACEGSVARLQCGKDEVISVSRATYGRRDQKTCSAGRPEGQLQNIKCSSSSGKVAERCNGKQQCDFKADNSEFGDPCQGTYKYLEVEYTCEEPEKGSPQKSPTVACEGSVARLQCGKDEVISVSRATYGRRDQKTCSAGRPEGQLQNIKCSSSSGKVAERCNGKQQCDFKADNSEFGDPCQGTYKYLEVEYTCEEPEKGSPQKSPTVACEGSVARLQCGKDEVISVSRATYGRLDQKTCSAGRPEGQLQNIKCSSSSGKVAERCNGKQQCDFKADNSEFGDPCQGTYKYLEVEYTCEEPEKGSPQKSPTVACEGSVAQLQCGKDEVISVSRATYGRRDQKTCSAGRPEGQLQNIKCSSSSGKVAERCNGKQQCDFKADNSEFGDPCQGTYKYLEVEYTCEKKTEPEKGSPQKSPTVACEGSVAQLQCGKDEVISVSRATYGRLDQKTCSAGRPEGQLQNIKCSSSSDKVAERCNGKQQCDFKAVNSEFGDPCQGTYKYLEVEYTCEKKTEPECISQKDSALACEGRVAKLRCGKDEVISVSGATYGRRDQKTCSTGRPEGELKNTQCSMSSDKVAKSCNGRRWCNFEASNSVFGDPCVGTYKYLEVEYTCEVPERRLQNATAVVCEGKLAQLRCGKGEGIYVSRATYGRRDQKTCSTGRPAGELKNTQCSSSSDKVAKRCNGRRACKLRATNSVFGDPCVGTYKYLEVDYLCYATVTG